MSAPDRAFAALWDCRLGLSSTEVPSMVVDIIWSVNVFYCVYGNKSGWHACMDASVVRSVMRRTFSSWSSATSVVLADGDTCDPRTVVYSLRRPLLSGHFMFCLRKN